MTAGAVSPHVHKPAAKRISFVEVLKVVSIEELVIDFGGEFKPIGAVQCSAVQQYARLAKLFLIN